MAEYVFGLVVWLGGWVCKVGGTVVCGGCWSCWVVDISGRCLSEVARRWCVCRLLGVWVVGEMGG